jgi:LacI family transcriptional regulator
MKGGRMNGQEIWVHPTHIVTRMSTDILAVADRDISTAVCYIRRNPNRMIQVDDVVRATNVSRRVLEKRFKAVLRRSVYQEIRRVRVGYIIQLLIDSNMSITEIAIEAGFDGVEHVSRYFRKETGMSLREYRNRHASR